MVALLLITTGATSTSLASDALESAHACGSIEEDAARLVCYDALFRSSTMGQPKAQADAATETKQVEGRNKNPSPEADSPTVVEVAAFGIEEAPETKQKTLSEITAQVVRIGKTSSGRQTYHLDNDQVWVKKTDRPFTIREGDLITIRSGRFGSFSLQTPRNARTDVERIR